MVALWPSLHHGQILFKHVRQHPYLGEIGNLVQHLSGHETFSLNCGFFDHRATGWGTQGDILFDLALLLQRLQVGFRYVPVAQPLQGILRQPLYSTPDVRTAIFDRLQPFPGDKVFMLCRDQFRAVHIHQRLTFFYRLAGGVHVEPLDPALELGRHGVQPTLIRLHRRHCPHRAGEFPQGDGFGFHPQFLYFFGADLHHGAIRWRLFTLVNREVVHAHRIFLRHRRGVGVPHRVTVVKNLALFAFCCRALRASWPIRSQLSRIAHCPTNILRRERLQPGR